MMPLSADDTHFRFLLPCTVAQARQSRRFFAWRRELPARLGRSAVASESDLSRWLATFLGGESPPDPAAVTLAWLFLLWDGEPGFTVEVSEAPPGLWFQSSAPPTDMEVAAWFALVVLRRFGLPPVGCCWAAHDGGGAVVITAERLTCHAAASVAPAAAEFPITRDLIGWRAPGLPSPVGHRAGRHRSRGCRPPGAGHPA